MLFNSWDFVVFLPLLFVAYWFLLNKKLHHQNVLVLLGSYVFYGWWDWRFLLLIAFSTVFDFFIAQKIQNTEDARQRKLLLVASLSVNLGLLGFFKYFNFFLDNLGEVFSIFNLSFTTRYLDILLPVGISFYTFQTLSYTIDVYRKKINARTDIVAFGAFVSFFPQLVAGPIERASHLLPQFEKSRTFDYRLAVNGLRQILWGFFKKMVIADNFALYANEIFNNSADYSGSTLLLGGFCFAIQIYGDFSGYSDIAIGLSRLFGFDLKQNFAFPYFSRDIAEFWRRWHISLSTWFRDYVYIPLGGSRGGRWMQIRNTFLIFIISGFWHGANWTFLLWGVLNACYFLPLLLSGANRTHMDVVSSNGLLMGLKDAFNILVTFLLVTIGWIVFRANDLSHAFSYLSEIFSPSLFTVPDLSSLRKFLSRFGLVVFFFLVEWLGKRGTFAIDISVDRLARPVRWLFYLFLILCIIEFHGTQQEFIYFQF